MKKLHLIYTPFTGVGLQAGYRGDAWFKHRIQVFKDYTLKSLLNQTNRDFIYWISFRPQEETNPQVGKLEHYLTSKSIRYIFTFNGLIYWDDKYPLLFAKKLLNFARIARNHVWREHQVGGLVSDMIESCTNKNRDLRDRLLVSLSIVEEVTGREFDWVYLTRIDSDDMLHAKAIDRIQAVPPQEKRAVVFKNGYVYNAMTGELAEWTPPTNPPFHTIIYPAHTFFDADAHLAYMDGFQSHEDIPRIFDAVELLDDSYSYVIHGKSKKDHISTMWGHPFMGNTIVLKKKEILADFGLTA